MMVFFTIDINLNSHFLNSIQLSNNSNKIDNNTFFIIKKYISQQNPYIAVSDLDELTFVILKRYREMELLQNIDALAFLIAVIEVESSFNRYAISPSGAMGYMQIMPQTAFWLLQRQIPIENLFQTDLNIQLGIQYINYLYKQFKSIEFVAYAYNSGEFNFKIGYYDPRYWKKISKSYQKFVHFRKAEE